MEMQILCLAPPFSALGSDLEMGDFMSPLGDSEDPIYTQWLGHKNDPVRVGETFFVRGGVEFFSPLRLPVACSGVNCGPGGWRGKQGPSEVFMPHLPDKDSANISYKGLDSTNFWLRGPRSLCRSQSAIRGVKAATDDM
jgi:hypothetical protein